MSSQNETTTVRYHTVDGTGRDTHVWAVLGLVMASLHQYDTHNQYLIVSWNQSNRIY